MYEKLEELGSIIGYFYLKHGDNPIIYTEEVPKDFKEPSIYFHTPFLTTNRFTTHSFEYKYTWLIKIFDTSTLKAQEKAMNIIKEISDNKFYIPIVNFDGSATNNSVKINDISFRKIDTGVIQIELKFNLAYFFNTPEYVKFQEFYIKEKIKED